jgi:hypothetical protein
MHIESLTNRDDVLHIEEQNCGSLGFDKVPWKNKN